MSDLTSFSNQGFFYDEAKKLLYYPLTKGNRSIVLVYRNVSPKTTGTATSATDLSFRITSAKYSSKFEIENVGVSGGKLYLNTNRANSHGAYDGSTASRATSRPSRIGTPPGCVIRIVGQRPQFL